MAYPASQQLLVAALQEVGQVANRTRVRTVRLRDLAAAGPVDRRALLDFMSEMTGAINSWASANSLSGIVQYARDQFDDPTLDVVAEFSAMRNAATTLRDWIFNNFPKDAGGAWLINSYDNTGNSTSLQFTQAQLTQFIVSADALIATIS